MEKGLPPGFLHFHLSSMVFLFTRVNSLMPFLYSMVLHHHCYLRTVCMAKILPYPMPLAAHMVLSRLSGTINEVRDLTARLMTEVCHDVQVELHLQVRSCDTVQQ